jgi:hypothetical protein
LKPSRANWRGRSTLSEKALGALDIIDARKAFAQIIARVAALEAAGDELAAYYPAHTHGMMGKSPAHRCDRCDLVTEWSAAKAGEGKGSSNGS